MDQSLKALDCLLQELSALEVPKRVKRAKANKNALVTTSAKFEGEEQYYLDTDAEDVKVDKLKKKIQQLKEDNAHIIKRFAPSLRRRVNLRKMMSKPNDYLKQIVGVGGWIRTTRNGKGFVFIKLYDGTTAHELQVIASEGLDNFDKLSSCGVGTSLFVIGEIVSSMGKEQAVEMQAIEVRVLGECDPTEYPLAGKRHPLEYLRTIQHFRPRSTVLGAVNRVRNTLAFATHQFFQNACYV